MAPRDKMQFQNARRKDMSAPQGNGRRHAEKRRAEKRPERAQRVPPHGAEPARPNVRVPEPVDINPRMPRVPSHAADPSRPNSRVPEPVDINPRMPRVPPHGADPSRPNSRVPEPVDINPRMPRVPSYAADPSRPNSRVPEAVDINPRMPRVPAHAADPSRPNSRVPSHAASVPSRPNSRATEPVDANPRVPRAFEHEASPTRALAPANTRALVPVNGNPRMPPEAESHPVDDEGNQVATIVITEADTTFKSSTYKGISCTKTINVYKHTMKVCQGNICLFKGSAIVNAANEGGIGGGGVDGAITKAGGAVMHEARANLPELEPDVRIRTGTAVLTIGGALPAGHVIHAVGPIYPEDIDSTAYEACDKMLRSAYTTSLQIAAKAGFRSITFPLVCGGVFRGRRALDMVIKIGWSTCFKFLKTYRGKKMTICFISFSEHEGHILRALARESPRVECSFMERLCG